MVKCNLAGRRILVVEDVYVLAAELARALAQAGAVVVGPAPSVEQALCLIQSGRGVDGALLDIDLVGEDVYEVADVLDAMATPYIFTTGYEVGTAPRHYAHVQHYNKPIDLSRLTAAMRTIF